MSVPQRLLEAVGRPVAEVWVKERQLYRVKVFLEQGWNSAPQLVYDTVAY